MGDLKSSAEQDGGAQKAVQLAITSSSVLNVKTGEEGEQGRAAVSIVALKPRINVLTRFSILCLTMLDPHFLLGECFVLD